MSRSVKKTPAGGITTSDSEKYDKKKWHKRLRQKTKQMLTSTRYDESEMSDAILPEVHDVSDPWNMSKDGKSYYGEERPRRGKSYYRMGHNRYINVMADWFRKLIGK